MAYALQVPATEFSRGFGKIRDKAHEVGVIEVTSHDRVVGAYISAKELEHFNTLKRKERRVIAISDIDDDLLSLIENAKYGEVSE